MTSKLDRIQENANSYIVKNCPAFGDMASECYYITEIKPCYECPDCVIKRVIEKLREADNSCDGIDCTGCSGFYMCHSQFANELLKLFDIEEINK